MEKIAIIEINTNNVKLMFSHVVRNKSFVIYNEVEMPINLIKDFDEDEIIKSNSIQEIISILTVYKKMINIEGVSEIYAFATNFVRRAKNQNGFLNELYNTLNVEVKVLSANEEINYIYSAVINTFNKPKALIVNISDYDTKILLYNRRNVIETAIIPFGSVNVIGEVEQSDKPEEMCENITNFISDKIKELSFMSELEEEFEVIGVGRLFLNLGVISRRAKKYPLDVEHNYPVSKEDFEKVFALIKPLDQVKAGKIKGIKVEDTKYLPSGLSILSAIYNKINKDVIHVSKSDKIEGILLNTIIPLTLEKPISDNLGYSLQVLNEYYDVKSNNSEHVYNLSMILFKQLKVLHKLSRSYVRVLRVASYLSASGKRIDFYDHEKASFNVILNSNIYGVSHAELVLASFVALLRNPDNFNLTDWIRYKDLLDENDLDAVKKLAVILNIAESLDITSFKSIEDISCDILGDSVIMKTIATQDVDLEIKKALTWSTEFKRAFNKNLEIL